MLWSVKNEANTLIYVEKHLALQIPLLCLCDSFSLFNLYKFFILEQILLLLHILVPSLTLDKSQITLELLQAKSRRTEF